MARTHHTARVQVQGGPGGAALTVATTHMSSLARLKFDTPSGVFENASAEFDEETLTPTYRLLWGIPGRSCALSVAAGLGVPQDILEEAREVVGSSQACFPPHYLGCVSDCTVHELSLSTVTVQC